MRGFSDSFLKLSEKCFEQRSTRGFGRHTEAKMDREYRFCGFEGHVEGVLEAFRTVS
jgi:hypothetical protein